MVTDGIADSTVELGNVGAVWLPQASFEDQGHILIWPEATVSSVPCKGEEAIMNEPPGKHNWIL